MDDKIKNILKVRIAYMFYEKGLTKREISKRLHISRPTVLKLLKEAKDEGIVRIEIIDKNKNIDFDLEEKVKDKYGLKDIKIIKNDLNLSNEKLKMKIGNEAAFYCERYIKSHNKIGISWGATLKYMINNLKENKSINIEVVSLLGGFNNMGEEVSATILCGKLLSRYKGKEYILFSPAILENNKYTELFLLNNEIKYVFEKMKYLDIALVGIGPYNSKSALIKNNIFSNKEIQELNNRGAVGNICCHFYDKDGKETRLENRKVVGINLEDLKKIKRVIGIAGGFEKIGAIKGALNGNLINELITDDITAKELLKN